MEGITTCDHCATCPVPHLAFPRPAIHRSIRLDSLLCAMVPSLPDSLHSAHGNAQRSVRFIPLAGYPNPGHAGRGRARGILPVHQIHGRRRAEAGYTPRRDLGWDGVRMYRQSRESTSESSQSGVGHLATDDGCGGYGVLRNDAHVRCAATVGARALQQASHATAVFMVACAHRSAAVADPWESR